MLRPLLFSFVFFLSSFAGIAQNVGKQPVTAILGAFHEEVRLLQASLTDRQEQRIQGLLFVTGKIGRAHV